MRPYPDELLRSMRRSLNEVIIPNLADDWARYVAKGMEKIIVHLELRLLHEPTFLVQDTDELKELLAGLADDLVGEPLVSSDALVTLADDLRATAAALPAEGVDVRTLTEANEVQRGALVRAIETMEVAAQSDPALGERLEPLRERMRAFIRRELDRDIKLAEPTFMLFGPPVAPEVGRKGVVPEGRVRGGRDGR